MNTQSNRKILIVGAAIVVLLVSFLMYRQGALANRNNIIQLQPPPFVGIAHAQNSPTSTSDIGALLDAEAGISAYYKSPDAITLSQVRGQFRTIEIENSDYIIGSVAVPNYEENFDAHVYVHKSGWILAYYLRADPVSKIIDVKAQTVNTTKLKTVVSAIASAAGAPFTDVTYYDFRYPNATNILFVGEDVDNGNDFTIQIPSTYGYFERSWALYANGNWCYFTVDGQNQPGRIYSSNGSVYGTLTASELLPDTLHTITVDKYGALVIVYRVL